MHEFLFRAFDRKKAATALFPLLELPCFPYWVGSKAPVADVPNLKAAVATFQ